MRYPVVYKNIQLMPCTKRRARSLVRSGRAVFVKDKHLGIYVKLKQVPSGYHTDKLVLGVDTGTMFTGFSVVNKDNSFNVEIEHTQRKEDKQYIKKKTASKKIYKLLKRTRLRHRECRFDNRTGNKVTYTENYYYQNIRNWIQWICKLYPITDIVIEDVASVHNKETKNAGFSPIEQIKTRLYDFCKRHATVWVSKANPKVIRLFDKNVDLKESDKAAKTFFAHCLDSHSLACLVLGEHVPFDENILYIKRRLPNIDKNRRNLRREMTARNAKPRHLSKKRKIRARVNDKQGNHGPWTYSYTERTETKSKRTTPYGSSIKISDSHSENCKKGENKYKYGT